MTNEQRTEHAEAIIGDDSHAASVYEHLREHYDQPTKQELAAFGVELFALLQKHSGKKCYGYAAALIMRGTGSIVEELFSHHNPDLPIDSTARGVSAFMYGFMSDDGAVAAAEVEQSSTAVH